MTEIIERSPQLRSTDGAARLVLEIFKAINTKDREERLTNQAVADALLLSLITFIDHTIYPESRLEVARGMAESLVMNFTDGAAEKFRHPSQSKN